MRVQLLLAMMIFMLTITGCNQIEKATDNPIEDTKEEDQQNDPNSSNKDEQQNNDTKDQATFSKKKAQERMTAYKEHFQKLINERTDDGKLPSFKSTEELSQYFQEVMTDNWAKKLISTYIEKKDSGLYLLAMDSPLWLQENKEFLITQKSENRAVLSQERNNEMIGHVNMVVQFALDEGQWFVDKVETTPIEQMTEIEAEQLVRNELNIEDKMKVEFDHMENGQFVIHVYEVVNNHTATHGWYYVHPKTKQITNMMNTDSSASIKEKANEIMKALAEKDMDKLASYVHPTKGLLFSPYVFIDDEALTFNQNQLSDLLQDQKLYNWGSYDGSGKPIKLTTQNYFKEFVYDVPFLKADEILVNELKQRGNTINNISDVFPKATFVEYYRNGTEENNNMDWASLILVLQQQDSSNEWYLVAIVHNEWTI